MEGDLSVFDFQMRLSNFNPLPPHGGRPGRVQCAVVAGDISIHSLRMEGDPACSGTASSPESFQSTPSAWRETPFQYAHGRCTHFNPLPPHGGRQYHPAQHSRRSGHFNPLPPHGGRPCKSLRLFRQTRISIHSLRMEGDCVHLRHYLGTDISIHSLRMEGDVFS